MNTYKVLTTQVFEHGDYKLVPIRFEDRYDIMKWRNEQIYHLRQNKPLTRADQDKYFNEVVAALFKAEKPEQILFSFLKGGQCIGYGGLVHINWIDQNAEVSFVLDTTLEEAGFEIYWETYLYLLKKIAFKFLNLRKIYTYAFDLRPKLYVSLKKSGFKEECRLIDHCKVQGKYRDVLIHSFWNPNINLELRPVKEEDVDTLYNWANDPVVRGNSFNPAPISYESHEKWFQSKLEAKESQIFIFQNAGMTVGQIRLDKNGDWWEIDYSVDKVYRGLGVGTSMIELLIQRQSPQQLKALVRKSNIASQKVFERIGFDRIETSGRYGKETYYEYYWTA